MSNLDYPFSLTMKTGRVDWMTAQAHWAETYESIARACIRSVREAGITESEIQSFEFEYDGNRYSINWQTK